jgi:hypothetical protein
VRRQHQREDRLERDPLTRDRLPAEVDRLGALDDLDLLLRAEAEDQVAVGSSIV